MTRFMTKSKHWHTLYEIYHTLRFLAPVYFIKYWFSVYQGGKHPTKVETNPKESNNFEITKPLSFLKGNW